METFNELQICLREWRQGVGRKTSHKQGFENFFHFLQIMYLFVKGMLVMGKVHPGDGAELNQDCCANSTILC